MFKPQKSDTKKINGLKFIDLFAGIGGFHLALKSFNAECVFTSEWDKNAQDVYKENFNIKPHGDITQIKEGDIPKHDIICGGFPCQAFSISGKQKGFEDSRGTLFFDVARIAAHHQPKILFLENVFNFEKHDNGKTLKTVLNVLDNIGYNTFYKVLNASKYGIPQIRKRIYFVAFRKDLKITQFNFPEPIKHDLKLRDFLEKDLDPSEWVISKDKLKDLRIKEKVVVKSNNVFLSDDEHGSIRLGTIKKGGQGDRIYSPDGFAITLSAYGGGTGSKTGLYMIDGNVRKLTPRECANITGFPNNFKLSKNKNHSYKQFGNCVVVDVLQYILIEINKKLNEVE
jgi:DNA (cytosine-5)-methyltransferase 1